MVLVTGGYGPVIYGCREGLWGVPMLVVYQIPRGLHPEPYNGICFAEYYKVESGWNTWSNVASETTKGKRFHTEVSKNM